jgi:hypothetical protein
MGRVSNKKSIKKTQSKNKITRTTLAKHGYSFNDTSIKRLKSLISYANKFGMSHNIKQVSRLMTRHLKNKKITNIILKDLNNLYKSVSSTTRKKLLKGGAQPSLFSKMISISSGVSKKAGNYFSESIGKVSKKLSNGKKTLNRQISSRVQTIGSIGKKIKNKTNKLDNKIIKIKNNIRSPAPAPQKKVFSKKQCDLCLKHCKSNGINSNNNTNNNKNRNNGNVQSSKNATNSANNSNKVVKKNSKTTRLANLIISNQSIRSKNTRK